MSPLNPYKYAIAYLFAFLTVAFVIALPICLLMATTLLIVMLVNSNVIDGEVWLNTMISGYVIACILLTYFIYKDRRGFRAIAVDFYNIV